MTRGGDRLHGIAVVDAHPHDVAAQPIRERVGVQHGTARVIRSVVTSEHGSRVAHLGGCSSSMRPSHPTTACRARSPNRIMACLARHPDDRPMPVELLVQLELLIEALPKPWLSKFKPRRGRR